MLRFIHYLSIGLSLLFTFKVISIIVFDIDRLTDYGYGYLTGQVLLLVVCLFIAYFTYRSKSNEAQG